MDIHQKLVQHSQWVKSLGKEGSQLSESDLDFRGIKVKDYIFTELEIPGSNFSDLDISNIDFYGSNLAGSVFKNVKAHSAIFVKANLDYAELSGDFTGANFFRSSLVETNFDDAKLTDAKMSS